MPVLLDGESGTGKERAARVLHYSGPATGAVVQVRCGALTPESLELELFGRVRGSSPDAATDRPGLFHLASEGTLYLADISDASRPIEEEEVAACEEAGIEYVELKIGIDGISVITQA